LSWEKPGTATREARVATRPARRRTFRLSFELDTGASPAELDTLLRLTERYCVVYQTLARPAQLTASLAPAGQ